MRVLGVGIIAGTLMSLVVALGVAPSAGSIDKSEARAYSKRAQSYLCEAPEASPAFLGCGETRCTQNSDCPSSCGPCITWSGTCALFQPNAL